MSFDTPVICRLPAQHTSGQVEPQGQEKSGSMGGGMMALTSHKKCPLLEDMLAIRDTHPERERERCTHTQTHTLLQY
jgi:hypothetical protein